MGLTKANFYKKAEVDFQVSMDDGGEMDMKVAEVLDSHSLKGTFYVSLDHLDKEGYLTWDQVKELDKRGFTIGSHTISHPMDLKKLHDEELWSEVQTSKDLLEAALGHPVESFCYPRGRADDRVKEEVMRAGYLTARGTGKPGDLNGSDKFNLPGTIHLFQREEYGTKDIETFAKEVIDKARIEGGYINLWGHSKEMQDNNVFPIFNRILGYAKGQLGI